MAQGEGEGDGADMTIACSVHGCKVVCTGVADVSEYPANFNPVTTHWGYYIKTFIFIMQPCPVFPCWVEHICRTWLR